MVNNNVPIELSWSDFKTLCTNKEIAMNYIPLANGTYEYFVFASDGNVIFGSRPTDSDATDFENNYMSDCNKKTPLPVMVGNNDKIVDIIDDPNSTIYRLAVQATNVTEWADYAKHGYGFYIWHKETLNTSQECVIYVEVGDIPLQFDYGYKASGSFSFDIYEGVTSVTGGDSFTPINRLRSSSNTSDCTVITDPTSYVLGTPVHLLSETVGQASEKTITGASTAVLYLKANTKYLFVLEAHVAQNKVNILFDWIETTGVL